MPQPTPNPPGDPFRHLDVSDANRECSKRNQNEGATCAKCKFRVILHCSDCKVQLTGCMCTEIERFGENEAVRRIFDQFEEEEARKRLKGAGIILPPGFKP